MRKRGWLESERAGGWLFAGAALLLAVLFFWEFVLDGSLMLLGTDMVGQGYQLRQFGVQEIQSGRGFPLWNPYVFGGQPFLAILPGPVFYPTSLLYLAPLPLFRAIGWTFVLHMGLGGIFAYWAARALEMERWAAAVSGLSFMFTGYVVSTLHGGQDGRMFAMVLIPLAFGMLERGLRSGRLGWFLGLGVAVALQIFTPHVQLMYFSSLMLTAYALVRVIGLLRTTAPVGAAAAQGGGGSGRRRHALKLSGMFALAFLLAGALGAAQLIPTWNLLKIGVRGGGLTGYEFASSWALPPQELTAFFLPDLIGSLREYWGSNAFKLHTEYFGAVPVALALLSLSAFRRDARVRVLAGLSTVCVLFALGAATPVHRLLYSVVPLISRFRAPAMMLGPVAFLVALLAGLGWQQVLDARRTGRQLPWRWLWLAVSPLLVFGLAAAVSPRGLERWAVNALYPPGWPGAATPQLTTALRAGGWWLLGGTVVAIGVGQGIAIGRLSARAVIVVLAFLVLDLGRVDSRYVETERPKDFVLFQSDPVIEHMQANLEPGERVFQPPWPATGRTYAENELMLHRLPSIAGSQNFRLRWFDQLVGGLGYENLTSPAVWPLFDLRFLTLGSELETPLLQAVETAPRARLYEVTANFEHAFFPRAVEAVSDSAEAIRRTLALADPTALAVVEVQDGQVAPPAGAGTATVERYEPNLLTLSVDADRGGLLFISEIFHPAWEARIDGKPAEILRTDGAFRGVNVPAGQHQLELRYSAREFRLGFGISGMALLGVLIAFGVIGWSAYQESHRRT